MQMKGDPRLYTILDELNITFDQISFHPCVNTASLVVRYPDFEKFLKYCGNTYEYLELY